LLPSPSPSSPSQGATGENDWFAMGIECFPTEDSDPFESFGQVAPVQVQPP